MCASGTDAEKCGMYKSVAYRAIGKGVIVGGRTYNFKKSASVNYFATDQG